MTRIARCLVHAGLVFAALLCALGSVPLARASDADAPVRAFGERLARAFNERDLDELKQLVDLRALGQRAAGAVFDDAESRANFAAGMAESSLLSDIVLALERTDGVVRMLKVVQRDGAPRPLLRWNFGDAGFDYQEYVLESDGKGSYRVVDWYAAQAGELVSVTVGAASQLLLNPSEGLVGSLLGVKKVDKALLEQFRAIGKLEREGKLIEAFQAIDALPEEVRSTRLLLRKASLAGRAQDHERYLETLAELDQRYGDAPQLALTLLDHYFMEEKWDRALTSIQRIEARVGTDGMTELLRANVYAAQGKNDEAVARANAAIQLEPDLEDAYFSLATTQVAQGRFDQAIQTLEQIRTRFGYDLTPDALAEEPAFAELVQSEAFKKWAAEAAAKEEAPDDTP